MESRVRHEECWIPESSVVVLVAMTPHIHTVKHPRSPIWMQSHGCSPSVSIPGEVSAYLSVPRSMLKTTADAAASGRCKMDQQLNC